MNGRPILLACLVALLSAGWLAAAEQAVPPAGVKAVSPDYQTKVAPIFRKYCNGCHNAKEAEGGLVLENFARVMRGGENGAVVVPGKAEKSSLVRVLEKQAEPFMPPEGNKGPTPAEIAVLKAWIAGGARPPRGGVGPVLAVPKIAVTGTVRKAINAVAYSPDGKRLAVARYGRVEILDAKTKQPVKVLDGLRGNVNDVGFSRDGKRFFAAAGEAGLFGEATLWETKGWKPLHTLTGHRDSLYAAALSPDGKLLATGSYDHTVIVWEAASGRLLKTLAGHNGPVYALAFHPGGRILASASGDRTVKLWDVAAGVRLDTLNQPEKDQYTVAISPDGRYVTAGGIDNRIRVWEIRENGREGTNPLRFARFAHEAAIIRLTFSPDGGRLVSSAEDRTIKLWDADGFRFSRTLPKQSDWAGGLAVSPDAKSLAIGRLDGTLAVTPLAADDATTPVTSVGPAPFLTRPAVTVQNARPLGVPGTAEGTFVTPGKADFYRIEAKRGEPWIIETSAARRKSPVDTRIDVLHEDGRPVVRTLLRAVRDSYITFRPIDSQQLNVRVKNWEEMGLNQFLYLDGEVCRIFRMPQGPDSGFLFYAMGGKRRGYFETSATVHALGDPLYVVEPIPAGSQPADNGLPVFPIYFSNDDDANRKLGTDSRLTFTAPADGAYIVRVSDARGFAGKMHDYTLTVRRPKPDYSVTVDGKNPTVAAGSGRQFRLKLDRSDGFDGDVRVDITGLPAGFRVSTPMVIEAGHQEAKGLLHAALDAKAPSKEQWSQIALTATATIDGKPVVKPLGDLGEIKIEPKPKVLVFLEPDTKRDAASGLGDDGGFVIAPGSSITAMLRIVRNGAEGDLRFDVDNLPHGVIVEDLGLNGITILAGQTTRRIFLKADAWVPETSRPVHAISRAEGKQASPPIVLTVRKPGDRAAARSSDGRANPGTPSR